VHLPWRPRGGAWSAAVPVVLALAGVLFVASGRTAQGTDLQASRTTGLSGLIVAEQLQASRLAATERSLADRVAALTARVGAGEQAVATLQAQAESLGSLAGLDPVSGPAVVVTLNDAPRPTAGRTPPGNPTPDDLVVHQQDVQAVVNALWAGGARGMSIMDDRVVATTAVRCVGNTLLLDGIVYSPPYVVTAIGDPSRLQLALDESTDVQIYREYVAAFGLGYAVTTPGSTTLPGYRGPLELSSAVAAP